MKNATTLKIFVLYRAARGREATFHDIDKHLDAMDEIDYSPAGFMEIGGGISIVLDNYLTLYRAADFKAALDIIHFLMQSVLWLKGQPYEAEQQYPDQVALPTMNGDVLRLSNADADSIAIHYDRLNTRIPLTPRGSMFFSDVQVAKRAWLDGAIVALKEYQRLMDWVVEEGNAQDDAAAFLTALSKSIDTIVANS